MEEKFVKHDDDKADFTQIPQEALLEIAKVLTFGAKKYKAFNYSKPTNHRRYVAAALRHINQYLRNEDMDDETKTHHLSNAAASLMMVLDAIKLGNGEDDRNPVYGEKTPKNEEKCYCGDYTVAECSKKCIFLKYSN